MDNLKKNPIAMAIISGVGYLLLVGVIFFILSLFRKDQTFLESISDPIMIAVFAIGTVLNAVQGYNKAKKQLNGEDKK